MLRKKENLSLAEVRQKIFRYCAYQERSHLEVKNKLHELGAAGTDAEVIVTELITQGFLNEERFARAYAGGKFRTRSWGRIKISHGLEAKGLTANCIRAGLSEIDEEIYRKTLQELIEKKAAQTAVENLFVRRDKIANYVILKGFEPDLVWTMIKEIVRG